MVTREKACLAAAVAGIAGALFLVMSLTPGDGVGYVTILLRGAIVLVAFAVLAVGLVVRPPKPRVAWALVACFDAGALGMAFGMFRTSSSAYALRPVEVLGMPAILAASVQLAAFIVATAAAEPT